MLAIEDAEVSENEASVTVTIRNLGVAYTLHFSVTVVTPGSGPKATGQLILAGIVPILINCSNLVWFYKSQ